MKCENTYPIIVHNDYDVDCAYKCLSRLSSQVFVAFHKVKFVPSYYGLKTEDKMIYSYAAAKYQHLMIL